VQIKANTFFTMMIFSTGLLHQSPITKTMMF
jgi:hypothetical protein